MISPSNSSKRSSTPSSNKSSLITSPRRALKIGGSFKPRSSSRRVLRSLSRPCSAAWTAIIVRLYQGMRCSYRTITTPSTTRRQTERQIPILGPPTAASAQIELNQITPQRSSKIQISGTRLLPSKRDSRCWRSRSQMSARDTAIKIIK